MKPFDLAILGSGFGGSLTAMVARRLGLSVLLLERGSHPRFAIGESTSPLANLLLEELSHEYDLPRLLPLSTYGTWKRVYPEITVGLKRGFSFYHHREGERFRGDPDRQDQLLVAASPTDEVSDTHWYRAELDHFLAREARSLGAEYVERVAIDSLVRGGGVWNLQGEREGRRVRFRSRFLVDATGPRGALSRLLGVPEVPLAAMPATEALFSHFTGVGRFAEQADSRGAPYPPDDAALHHVFDGGWMWVLRFENGVTSAGVALERPLARDLDLRPDREPWTRVLSRYPSVGEQFHVAEPVLPFYHYPRLSYRSAESAGEGWAMLPSAAAFVDPLFSTGFPLTLLGIQRLGRLLKERWGRESWQAGLAAYAAATGEEADASARLVGACYRGFRDFPAFATLSMFYFVAASYSEMAQRLGRPHLASRFLLQDRLEFRRAFTEAAERGMSPDAAAGALAPFNIAGLCDPGKRNWYPLDMKDVIRGAEKLEATTEEAAACAADLEGIRCRGAEPAARIPVCRESR